MTMIPSYTLLQMVNQEREHEARNAAWRRAAHLARQCCEASAGLVQRVLRAVGFGRPATCEA